MPLLNPLTDNTRPALRPKKRPQSRASTTSIHSVTTQTNMDAAGFPDGNDIYGGQWMANDQSNSKATSQGPEMSPEDLVLHAAGQMQNAPHGFQMVDAAMAAHLDPLSYQQQQHHQQAAHPHMHHQHAHPHAHHGMQHPHPPAQQAHTHSMTRHPLPVEQYAGNASFTEGEMSLFDHDDQQDDIKTIMSPRRARATRSSANNEHEMRQLYKMNSHRKLNEVAAELHGNERGPNSERARQIFAMIWIDSVCSKGKGSVPRGRVYANYASRCATERITVLNPASFGKLVRVLFPGLKTRRLGVRGESKYHYVNFEIKEDQRDVETELPQPARLLAEPESLTLNNSPPASLAMESTTAPIRKRSYSAFQDGEARPTSLKRGRAYYRQPEIALETMRATAAWSGIEIVLPTTDTEIYGKPEGEAITLPLIDPYLPQGTDPDAAKSLKALYLSHCTSLVECIRYVREKSFFHLYTSFQGTLTMPVKRLLEHPDMAPWIEACDLLLYQTMMRIIARLVLQVVPQPVLTIFNNIQEKLVSHVRDAFQGMPQHVILAKESPAAIFAGLLNQALRANLAAHAAANMLANPDNRDQMYMDWITLIKPRKMAELVPSRGMDDVVNLLVWEMRDLLGPINVDWEVECCYVYGDVLRSRNMAGNTEEGDTPAISAIDRWVSLLHSLPSKFPYASHADIALCVERVGTAVMRDITMKGGKSFSSWWVLKTWLDEMVMFLGETGGFMAHKGRLSSSEGLSSNEVPKRRLMSQETTRQQSQQISVGDEGLDMADKTQSQPGRAPFPPPSASAATNSQGQPAMGGGDNPDDSGIVIQSPEDEFSIDKFAFTAPPEGPDLLEDEGLEADSKL
ncbi:hypothetical protein B0I35DRAFT_503313 [Stachybotrys elegans]|uniref:RFX-type winged-helix domain-containing protein n=1 Tax=Stachybotrys elegans TaxID=80388 RepID=A0A8K0SS00_9HYPO|nr:hypothetical protein B0I35DRAFT_503313 [Stachybotrys elegans]